MAFDKSVPHATMCPVLPDMLDDDDDDLVREVKMLSLITAQEEQEHRQWLNQELNLAGKPSDPNFRSSLTLQESSSLPELVGNAELENSSAAVYSQIARPRPHSGRSTQGVVTGVSTTPWAGTSAGAPSGAVVPPPLPAVRPNARSRLQTDPVRIPSPPRTAQRNRQEVSTRPRDTSASRSQSLSPPFHRTNLASYSIPDDLPAQGTVPHSSHDAPLICLSPPTSKSQRLDDFDLKSLDPFQPFSTVPPPLRNSPVTKTFSNPVPQNLPRPSDDPKVLPYRHSPVPYPLDGSHLPPSAFVGGGNDAAGSYPVVLGFMPWVTNDLCSPSSPGFPISWVNDSAGNIPSSSTAPAEIPSRNIPANSGSGSSNLMDFSTDHGFPQLDPVYMDLADFDPLYTVDSKTWNCEQRFESDELFLKPANTLPRSAVDSAARPAVAERPLAPLPDVVAESSVVRLTSVDELQDPFSVQDLMISLEKKRQKHVDEQQARDLKGVSSRRAQPSLDDSPTNATLSRRKV